MDADRQFTGKYEEGGRIGSFLVDRFYAAVRELLVPVLQTGDDVLEVGCGAGYSTQRMRAWMPADVHYSASDIGVSLVQKARARNPGIDVSERSVYQLDLPDRSIDVVVMLEVLEHLDDPQRALSELARVVRRHVVISTPREPIWRALNMCRGKYLGDLGNTPGHVQHWSTNGLVREVGSYFRADRVRQPLPWTVLLLSPHS